MLSFLLHKQFMHIFPVLGSLIFSGVAQMSEQFYQAYTGWLTFINNPFEILHY